MANKVQAPSSHALDTGQNNGPANLPHKLTENGSGDHHQMTTLKIPPGGVEVDYTNPQQNCDGSTTNGPKITLNGPPYNNLQKQNHVNKVSSSSCQIDNNNGSAHIIPTNEPACVVDRQSEVTSSPVAHSDSPDRTQSEETNSMPDSTFIPGSDSVDGLDEVDIGPRELIPPNVRVESPSPPRDILRPSPKRHPSTTQSLPPKSYLTPGDRRSKQARRNLTVTGVTDEARIVLEQFLQRSLTQMGTPPLRNRYQRYSEYQVTDTLREDVQTDTRECVQIDENRVVREGDSSPLVQRSISYRRASHDSMLNDHDRNDSALNEIEQADAGEDDSTSHEPHSKSASLHSSSSHSSSYRHKIHVRPTSTQAVYDALSKLKDVEATVDKRKKSKRKSWRFGSRKNTSSSSSDAESDDGSTRRKKSLFKRTTERLRESFRRIQDKPNKYKESESKSSELKPKYKSPKSASKGSPFQSPSKSSKSSTKSTKSATPLTPGDEKSKKFRFSLIRRGSADKEKRNSHRRSQSEIFGQVHTHTHVHIHQEVTPGAEDNGIFLQSVDTEMVQDIEGGSDGSPQHRGVVMREKESYPVKRKSGRFDRVFSQLMKTVRRKSVKENKLEQRSKSVDPINLQSTGNDGKENIYRDIQRPVPPELPPMPPVGSRNAGSGMHEQRQNMRLDGLDPCEPASGPFPTQVVDVEYESDVVERFAVSADGELVRIPVSQDSRMQVSPSPLHSLPSDNLVREGHSDTEDEEDMLDGTHSGDADNKPFHEKSPAEKEELLERVASQLVNIADNYDAHCTPSPRPPKDVTSPGAGACSAEVDDPDYIAGATAAPLTTSPSVEVLIGRILRSHADPKAESLADLGEILVKTTPRREIASIMARRILEHADDLVSVGGDDELNPMVTNLMLTASYDRFKDIVNTAMDDYRHEPGWQQVSMLFRLTKSAVKLTGLGTASALSIKEMTLKYFEDKFAGWVIGQGGWESMMEDSDLSSEVD